MQTLRFAQCSFWLLPFLQFLFQFTHYSIRNNLFRSLVMENLFSIFKCYVNCRYHIKRKFSHKIIICLHVCCSLNLRNNFCDLFLCDLLRYPYHFFSVFFGSAAVSILCATVSNSTVFRYKIMSGEVSKIFHYISPYLSGVGFWDV